MKYISFDTLRTYDFNGIHFLKPDLYLKEIESVRSADWILFPPYWQVNALVYGLQKKIFPSIATYHLGHNKIEMTRVLMTSFPDFVPYTEILSNTEYNQEFILTYFDYPFIAKEVKSSMGQGVYKIDNYTDFKNYCALTETLYVQEYLPIDRDMRIIFIGDQVVSSYWRIATKDNFKNNVAQGGEITYDAIPLEAIRIVSQIAISLGINHAGFDVAYVDGKYYIFEFNVMFGTQGLIDKKIPYGSIVLDYLNRMELATSSLK